MVDRFVVFGKREKMATNKRRKLDGGNGNGSGNGGGSGSGSSTPTGMEILKNQLPQYNSIKFAIMLTRSSDERVCSAPTIMGGGSCEKQHC